MAFGVFILGEILLKIGEMIPGEHIFCCVGCGTETRETVPNFGFADWLMIGLVSVFLLFLVLLVFVTIFGK